MLEFFGDIFGSAEDNITDFISSCEDFADKKDFKPDFEFDHDWDLNIDEEIISTDDMG